MPTSPHVDNIAKARRARQGKRHNSKNTERVMRRWLRAAAKGAFDPVSVLDPAGTRRADYIDTLRDWRTRFQLGDPLPPPVVAPQRPSRAMVYEPVRPRPVPRYVRPPRKLKRRKIRLKYKRRKPRAPRKNAARIRMRTADARPAFCIGRACAFKFSGISQCRETCRWHDYSLTLPYWNY